jgi:hypothetical protein
MPARIVVVHDDGVFLATPVTGPEIVATVKLLLAEEAAA